MTDLEYRILASTILTQTNTLFTRLITIINILNKETLHNRIRVSLRKEKRGIKKVFSMIPLTKMDINWQIISYGYTETVIYMVRSLEQISKPTEKQSVISVIQKLDSLRASIPVFSNAVFNSEDILKSFRNIKRAMRLTLMLDYTDLKNTNILYQWLAQESIKALNFIRVSEKTNGL